ncbi:MAG: zinc ribbon domain-containing protein [Candidatus Hodarchaeales archaeon]|jgi:ribosomal protein S27AE
MIPIVPIIIPPKGKRQSKKGGEGVAICIVISLMVILGLAFLFLIFGMTGFDVFGVLFDLVASNSIFIVILLVVVISVGASLLAVIEKPEHPEETTDYRDTTEDTHYSETKPRYKIVERRFCSKCGASLEHEDRFCASCGLRIW